MKYSQKLLIFIESLIDRKIYKKSIEYYSHNLDFERVNTLKKKLQNNSLSTMQRLNIKASLLYHLDNSLYIFNEYDVTSN